MSYGGSLPGMQVGKGRHADCTTHPDHGEVGREHLALQIPKLMPRQILEHNDAADEGDPEGSPPGSGEAEEVGEFEEGKKL